MSLEQMKLFEVGSADKCQLVQPVDHRHYELFRTALRGEPQAAHWHPISVRIIHEESGKKKRHSDAPWFSSYVLVFRERAKDSLGEFLSPYGEMLQLECAETDLFAFHCTTVLDALDEAASPVKRFDNGDIMMILRHVFKRSLAYPPIFRIASLRLSPLFVSDEFIEQWNRHCFRGLSFRLVDEW